MRGDWGTRLVLTVLARRVEVEALGEVVHYGLGRRRAGSGCCMHLEKRAPRGVEL